MKSASKLKSNLIFWGIFGTIIVFLYATPWGGAFRDWMGGVFLSSPNIEEHSNLSESEKYLDSDWQLNSTNNNEVWLSDTDQPIFLNIWATWCGPCRSELPSILSLEEKYGDKVTFLLISPDESIEKIKTFAKKEGVTFPCYNSSDRPPTNLYTSTYPSTFIINGDKEIVFKAIGAYDWDDEDIHTLLDDLIKNS